MYVTRENVRGNVVIEYHAFVNDDLHYSENWDSINRVMSDSEDQFIDWVILEVRRALGISPIYEVSDVDMQNGFMDHPVMLIRFEDTDRYCDVDVFVEYEYFN